MGSYIVFCRQTKYIKEPLDSPISYLYNVLLIAQVGLYSTISICMPSRRFNSTVVSTVGILQEVEDSVGSHRADPIFLLLYSVWLCGHLGSLEPNFCVDSRMRRDISSRLIVPIGSIS